MHKKYLKNQELMNSLVHSFLRPVIKSQHLLNTYYLQDIVLKKNNTISDHGDLSADLSFCKRSQILFRLQGKKHKCDCNFETVC